MKLFLALAGAFAVLLTFAPAAPAAAISIGYCTASLRGETGQAPDNDIKAAWDYIERTYGINIVSSSDNPSGWATLPNLTTNNGWRFYRSNGTVARYANFRCYWGTDGNYHDGIY
jgi:hypothetical protein